MEKTIFVIEDDDNIREMLKIALTSFSYKVSVFNNAEAALEVIEIALPDLVIFDIMLPGMSGIEATKKLRKDPRTEELPILMLTAKDTELDTVIGLDSGADDYITKPFGIMELGARIRSLLRRSSGKKQITTTTMEMAGLTINFNTREVFQNNKLIDLTFKEYELLAYLVKERNRVVPREELLNSIWGYDFLGESRTVDIHIATLRQKLGDDAENPRYIGTVRNVGYRFIGE